VNILLVLAGAAVAWPAREALGDAAGVRDVAVVEVPEPAGRADLDPALDGLAGRRLVVAGSPAAVGDVVTRLLRRDELGSTPVGVILGTLTSTHHRDDLGLQPPDAGMSPRSSAVAGAGTETGAAAGAGAAGAGAASAADPPAGPPVDLGAAARIAATGVPWPTDLVRDDHGAVLVDRAELAPWTGRRLGMRVYVDDTRLVNGEVPGLTVVRLGTGAISAEVWRRRTQWWRPGRTGWPTPAPGLRGAPCTSAAGRAIQVSSDEARLTLDGRVHPRPVTRRNWWLEPARWLLVRSPEGASVHRWAGAGEQGRRRESGRGTAEPA
jgi:hypothetical protein